MWQCSTIHSDWKPVTKRTSFFALLFKARLPLQEPTSLSIRYAFVGCLLPESRIRTLAFGKGDGYMDQVEYNLDGTPSPRLFLLVMFLMAIPMVTFNETTLVHAQVQCWTARQYQGAIKDKRVTRHLKTLVAAENILRQSQEFLRPPVPVRMRSTMAARLHDMPASRLVVRAYPERASFGIDLWQGECGLITQVDRVTGAFGQISVAVNDLSKDMFMGEQEIPQLTGSRGGYPEYNGWVVISKHGRLPWIPQTLGDRLDRIGAAREKALLDAQRVLSSRKAPNKDRVERTAELLRKTDAEGADKYVANMKRLSAELQSAHTRGAVRQVHLTKMRDDYRAYRNSFTSDQLSMPAVWADPDGSAQTMMEEQIAKLRELSLEDQGQIGHLREESRELERRAALSDDEAEARRLRVLASDRLLEADLIQKNHLERVAVGEEALRSAYELTNLKPGSGNQALAFKMDPTFLDRRQPGKLQVIAVSTLTLTDDEIRGQPDQAARQAWLERVQSSIDYAALAALLD